MDRDTLEDDLDLILGPSRDAELPGEWDWEPPLGTPSASAAVEPEEPEDSDGAPGGEPDGSADDDDEDEDD